MWCIEYIGCAMFAYVILRLIVIDGLKGVWPYLIAPRLGLSTNPAKLGKWAVVTGATDGIGKAYVEALVEKGMNIFMLSRNEKKLEAVSEEIRNLTDNPNFEIRSFAVDFSKADYKTYDEIEENLADLDVGVLVNNVGMAPSIPGRFMENSRKDAYDCLLVNDMSCLMMTHIVLKGMLEKRRGAIINVSSCSALRPMPWFAVYSATKALMNFFTKALTYEHKGSGVIIQVVRPWTVHTNMTHHRTNISRVPNARQFVRSSLPTLGITDSTSGSLWFQVYENGALSGICPDFIYEWLCKVDLTSWRNNCLKKLRDRQ